MTQDTREQEFKNKKVLITGGTKGLGLCLARKFAAQGAELFITYRSDHAGAQAAAAEIKALGARCEVFASDLSEDGATEKLFDSVTKSTDRLDIYVHNAAATAFKELMDIRGHHIDKTLNITVKSFVLNVQRVAALMTDGGAIVSVSGMDTLNAVPRHGLLGAAKSALETLTSYYANELASRGIRVNGVNPGFLETDSTRKYLGADFDRINQAFAKMLPLKRAPELSEIAEVILFLASKKSSWILGQTVCVDGGLDFALPLALP